MTSKYGAVPTAGYASKLEAEFARCLELRMVAAEPAQRVAWWTAQVPFYMEGPLGFLGRYTVDFAFGMADGSWFLVECKGTRTRDGELRRKVLEVYHGVKVRVWTKRGWA